MNYMNTVTLRGRLATEPEVKTNEWDGSRTMRLLVTVRSEDPRRVDVIPVAIYGASEELCARDYRFSDAVVIIGSLQRRLSVTRTSRVEVVATDILPSWTTDEEIFAVAAGRFDTDAPAR